MCLRRFVMEMEYSYREIYSYNDIIINGGNISKCFGKCINGDCCFNGEFLCAEVLLEMFVNMN